MGSIVRFVSFLVTLGVNWWFNALIPSLTDVSLEWYKSHEYLGTLKNELVTRVHPKQQKFKSNNKKLTWS